MKPGQQYVKVVLKEASREYNEITQFFEKTMCARKTPSQFMQVPWSVIVTVERIQSPLLLSNFLNCKDRVDANNPGNKNERRLFHGCKGAVCDSINVTGFNRSFAADNIGIYIIDSIYTIEYLLQTLYWYLLNISNIN